MKLKIAFSLIASLVCLSSAAFAQARVALVIGNSNYGQSGWELPNPVKTRPRMKWKLRSRTMAPG
ncbi:MAG: hypothetical protein ACI93G_000742 [Hyphomonas sp.]|jgi:hypothetical protein